MLYFKLQLGCLVVTLYFIINYIKGTIGAKYSCNKIFDAMMVTAPQAIIFDGVTAWTVNHLDIVPYKLNLALHCIFFVFMAVTVFLLYLYIMELTIGFNNKPQIICSCIPGAVTFILILAFLNKLEFLQGKITNYSMGFSVIVCYISVVLHFAAILILIIFKHKSLEKKKILGIVSFLALFLTILIIQIILPEVLLSALLPAISILGVYMNFENPSLKQLEIYNKNMVTSFATLVESRDGSTGGHIRRTKGYVEIILKQMKKNRVHRKELTKDYIENVISAAPMHDVGKISTPDYILQKPGKLTPEEYEIMKQHSVEGGKILEKTFKTLDEPEYQKIAYEVARYHHEKWNGKGYPDGLKETEIPLHARIMAIADVFDAVSAKRCYRDAMPLDTCFKIIEEGAGVDFDPELAQLFLNAKEQVLDYLEADKEMELFEKWTNE